MEIHITKIIKKDNTISYIYQQTGMDSIFNNVTPFYEYDQNIENVPDSIALIPFICNILPIIFVYDATLYVDEIDRNFLKSINKYRRGYKRLIPDMDFKGKIIAKKIINNSYKTNKNCMLFSGGLDAFNTLCINEQKIDDGIAVWGSDINIEDKVEWEKLTKSLKIELTKFNKKLFLVKTNFQHYLNYFTLNEKIAFTGDYWWHGVQHGLAFLGLIAPLAYLNGYKKIYIASTYTKKYRTICASDPYTDNCFMFGRSKGVHDGFKFDRCQKALNVYNKCIEKNIDVNVHVCFATKTANNCGGCEKCIRSYLNCRAINIDNKRLSIVPSISMDEIKKRTFSCSLPLPEFNAWYRSIVSTLNKTYKVIPEDLKWLNDLHFQKDKLNFRKLIKKIFPFNTFRGKIVRKIYNTIKK